MASSSRTARLVSVGALIALVLVPASLLLARQAFQKRAEAGSRQAAEAGKYDQSFQELAIAAAYAHDPENYWQPIGTLALKAGDPYNAVHYLEKARDRDLLDPEGWDALGAAYLQTGESDLALQAFAEAVESGVSDPATLVHLVDLHSIQGDYQAAAGALAALVELVPEDLEALRRYGLLLAAISPEEAVPVLSRLEEEAPEEAETYRDLGLSIRRARAALPLPEYVSLAAGRALAAAGEWEMARLALERAVELNPGYAEAWAYLGEAREQLGLGGREALDRAYALDPASLGVNLLFALYFQRAGDPESALAHLEEARRSDPENPTLVAEMASIVASAGDIEGAISLFERAIQLAPEDPLYWKILANFSIQNETRVVEVGLPAARQATLINPRDAEAFDLLGQAYLASANPALAERFLKQAAGLDPEYAPAAFHLGVLYLTTARNEQAREQLELAARLAPDTPLSDLADQLIENFFK